MTRIFVATRNSLQLACCRAPEALLLLPVRTCSSRFGAVGHDSERAPDAPAAARRNLLC